MQQDWKKLFPGREKEKEMLLEAWRQAKAGRPQLVTLLAETGFGKTRLVQEFYGWLNEYEDPNGYWPDTMGAGEFDKRINPESFPESSAARNIPWLWWGIQGYSPINLAAQGVVSGLTRHIGKLELHIGPIERAKQGKKLRLQWLNKIFNLASAELVGIALEFWEVIQLTKKTGEFILGTGEFRVEREQERHERLLNTTLAYFRSFLDPKDKKTPTIPVIVVLDDAQWLDPGTLVFIDRLFRLANAKSACLLVLATHWKQMWLDNWEEATGFEQEHATFAGLVKSMQQCGHYTSLSGWTPEELKPFPDDASRVVLSSALPGLSIDQREAIVVKCSGNVCYLHDIIDYFTKRPEFFTGDLSTPLTQGGEKEIKEVIDGSHTELVQKWFEALQPALLQRLLGWGGLQGMRFADDLALALEQRFPSEGPVDSDEGKYLLQTAECSFGWIERIRQALLEFRQKSYRDEALKKCKSVIRSKDEYSIEKVRNAMLDILNEWFKSDKLKELDPEELETLLALWVRELQSVAEFDHKRRLELGTVLVRIFRMRLGLGDARAAAELGRLLAEYMPEGGWPLRVLDLKSLTNLQDILNKFAMYDIAVQLSTAVEAMEWQAQKHSPEYYNSLAMLYMNRGYMHANLTQTTEAMADYNRAVEIRGKLQNELEPTGQWPPEWRNDLANVYVNRGNLLVTLCRNKAALTDYNRAVEIRRKLRNELEPTGQWPPEWSNDLANVYMNRGSILTILLRPMAALNDYNRSERIRRGLRDKLKLTGKWPLEWRNDLANVYLNRGNLLVTLCKNKAALADYNRTVEIRRKLRNELEPTGQWSPKWRNDLANVYMNRGSILKTLLRPRAALTDYNRAVEIRKELRNELEPKEQWPPEWRDSLAKLYINRGYLLESQNMPELALDDYNCAEEIMKGLRNKLEPKGQWVLEWSNDLAMLHMNRGILLDTRKEHKAALDDYDQSAAIWEGLRSSGQLRPEWSFNLVKLYMNRGAMYDSLDQYKESLGNYNLAEELMKELRDKLKPFKKWPPRWRNELATLHFNRGGLNCAQGRRRATQGDFTSSQFLYLSALSDYNCAEEIRSGIRDEFKPKGQWLIEWRNDLAAVYMNRGVLLHRMQRPNACLDDCNRSVKIMEEVRDHLKPLKKWSPELRSRLASLYINLGLMHDVYGNTAKASQHAQQALDILQQFQQEFGGLTPQMQQTSDLVVKLLHAAKS